MAGEALVQGIKKVGRGFWFMRVGLPAVAGLGAGNLLPERQLHPSKPAEVPALAVQNAEPELPDDPAIVRIAALAGRTTEAKLKVRDLVAAGANDEEIAEWLSLVLFSDPGWLDNFIQTVPEDRRIALSRLTIFKVGKLQADAAWQLIRNSPYALQAARSDVEIERRKGLNILGYCMGSPLAAETLLNPVFGFTDEEINRNLPSTYGGKNVECILEAWKQGRWKDDPPGFVRDAWAEFRILHEDDLPKIEKDLPVEIRNSVERFNAYFEQQKQITSAPVGQLPTHEEMAKFSEAALNTALDDLAESGIHVSLESLVRLPEKLRKPALEQYFDRYDQYDSFHPKLIRDSIEAAAQLDLTPSENQVILEKAALLIWQDQGDYQTALDWLSQIPDAKSRVESQEKILTELAQQDPQSALESIIPLPAGELRDKIERLATEALP